jgi:hypothetical protein
MRVTTHLKLRGNQWVCGAQIQPEVDALSDLLAQVTCYVCLRITAKRALESKTSNSDSEAVRLQPAEYRQLQVVLRDITELLALDLSHECRSVIEQAASLRAALMRTYG